MKNKILYSGIILAFVIGISLSNVNAISPFIEIGNLEMEVLDAINDVIASLNAEIIRTESLNSTQISERVEQDGMQNNITTLQTQFNALPVMIIKKQTDTNNPDCAVIPIPDPQTEWCPNNFSTRFVINDTNITNTSTILLALKDSQPNTCSTYDIDISSFKLSCATGPTDGAQLYYIIIN